jgi:hypothetical protein
MRKFIPMAVVAACIATAAFASIRQPAVTVQASHAVVDTLPQDTSQYPTQETTPTDNSNQTDTSGVIR